MSERKNGRVKWRMAEDDHQLSKEKSSNCWREVKNGKLAFTTHINQEFIILSQD